jgi:nucleoside transporter
MWFVPLGGYMSKALGFDDIIGSAFGMIGLATILSTLLVGMLADRYVSAERLLATISLLAGLSLLVLSCVTGSRSLFLLAMLVHCLFYSSSLPVAVSLTFASLQDPARQYPSVRIFGTIGYIAAGLAIGLIPGAGQSSLPMQLGAAIHLLTALYCLTLPHSPPCAGSTRMGVTEMLGLDVVKSVRQPAFWVFIAAVLLMVIPKKFYDGYLNVFLVEKSVSFDLWGLTVEPTAIQTLGQVVEMATLLTLPAFISRFGIRRVMIVGMLGWIARFLCWAFGFSGGAAFMPLILTGILLHGLSYDFFFVSGQIWLDRRFPPEARGRIQAFYWFILSGLGVVLGSNLAGAAYRWQTIPGGGHDWRMIWLTPAAITAVVLLLFLLIFRESAPESRPKAGAS